MLIAPDPGRVSARFARSIKSYENEAQVQHQVSRLLVDTLDDYPEITYGRLLEIGSCIGSMTEQLCLQKKIDTLYVNDLVESLAQHATERISPLVNEAVALPGNIENIDLPQNLDLILSSSTFQWLIDYSLCIKKLSEALVDNGYLIFSMFREGTLRQIRMLTGIGLDYLSDQDLARGLAPHFDILHSKTMTGTSYFDTPRDVLRHIQATGVSGVAPFSWTKSRLQLFEADYRETFGSERGMPLDYVSTLIVARKKNG